MSINQSISNFKSIKSIKSILENLMSKYFPDLSNNSPTIKPVTFLPLTSQHHIPPLILSKTELNHQFLHNQLLLLITNTTLILKLRQNLFVNNKKITSLASLSSTFSKWRSSSLFSTVLSSNGSAWTSISKWFKNYFNLITTYDSSSPITISSLYKSSINGTFLFMWTSARILSTNC